MKCVVVSPEKTVLDVEAESVVLPLTDGEYGVLPGHTPLIARLGAGELRIQETGGAASSYYVENGFVEVLGNSVALLTMRILPVDELDVEEAEKKLQSALDRAANTPELAALNTERVINRRARLRVARKYAKR
ncbi:MAG: ATP synthase F1 subunit epsilon [Planctomycetaceae bacterium]|jgi:F-type H+-transporting ATPase subunit epsilon|nr:ATP synthase F1 subunit epsilon [Planctomycetaceae bacterium]